MKKKCFFLLTLLSLVMNLSASDVLSVVSNSNSGIYYVNYTGTLDDGSTLGFYRSGSSAYFCGAISTASSLSVPETIQIGQTQVDVTYCGRYSGETLDLDDAASVTSLTLPSTVTNIYNYIPASVTDLHLQSTNPPSISSAYLQSVTVWVPETAFSTYQSECRNYESDWSNSIELHYEGWEPKTLTVNVAVAGTFGVEILKQISQWTEVDALVVKGSLSEEEMELISRFSNLRTLDLSQTDIKTIMGCHGLTRLKTVNLPSTVTEVGSEAFSGCTALSDINLPNVTSIGMSAFKNCVSLKAMDFPKVTSVGASAFYHCTSLKSIKLPLVKEIEGDTFHGCSSLASIEIPNVERLANGLSWNSEGVFYDCTSLKSIDLSKVTELGSYAFYGCNQLEQVILAEGLEVIPEYCFSYCRSLKEITFPSTLKLINSNAFYCSSWPSYGSMTSITIPASVEEIASDAFTGQTSVKDVYCYSVAPINTTAFTGENFSAATLHVPAFSLSSYMLDSNWYRFNKTVALDGTLGDLAINQSFTINTYEGLSAKPNLTLGSKAHLNVKAASAFNIGSFTQKQAITYTSSWDGGTQSYFYTYSGSTLIADNEIKADTVTLSMWIQTNRWNFISLPFDVNVSDIQCTDSTLWVIRKYSGADRAALSGNTWQNMNSGTTLQAGEGYILHCAHESRSTVEFVFRAVDNARKNGIFAHQDVVKPLGAFPSEHAHNRGWNLVGNPYPSFYRTTSIEHNGVITVWSPSSSSWSLSGASYSYTAYSLLDDDYVLRPNEAFFVQCPSDATSMTFKAEGRTHEYSSVINGSYAREVAGMGASERQVYNVTLSNDTHSDRARVVINDKAKLDYEISCDASKFMSDNPDVPQLYVIDGDVHYAIDERPLSNGVIALGMRLGQSGTYNLQLSTKGTAGQSVVLTDKETGKQTDLTKDGYTFTAEPGICNARFTLTIGDDETAIRAIESSATPEGDAVYYDMNGRRVSGDGHGIFIVKQNGKSRKVVK